MDMLIKIGWVFVMLQMSNVFQLPYICKFIINVIDLLINIINQLITAICFSFIHIYLKLYNKKLNMHVDINIPKSKSISICFAVLRQILFIYLGTNLFNQLKIQNDFCSSNIISYVPLINIFTLVTLCVNVLTLIYFYCNNRFAKFEYYIYYILHIILTLFLIISSAMRLSKGQIVCNKGYSVALTILIIGILINITFIWVMVIPIYLAIKSVNIGGTVFWPLFWIIYRKKSQLCSYSTLLPDFISILHFLILFISLITFSIVSLLKKTTQTARAWKFITWMSIVFMIISYGISVYYKITEGGSVRKSCQFRIYYLQLYLKHGWIELIPPILLLIFLKSEKGDPRQVRLKGMNNQQIITYTGEKD